MAENMACSCGCGALQTVSGEAQCRCGCSCCDSAQSREQEIAELKRLLDSTQRRLSELGAR
jgi:hypothetical protein